MVAPVPKLKLDPPPIADRGDPPVQKRTGQDGGPRNGQPVVQHAVDRGGPSPLVRVQAAPPQTLELQRPVPAADPPRGGPRRDVVTAGNPGTLSDLSQQFGAQLDRLPAGTIANLRAAYQRFTDPATARQGTAPFLQTMATALVQDRRRVVAGMAERPDAELVRLAPAIQQQAGLMRTARAANYLAAGGSQYGFDRMMDAMSLHRDTDIRTQARTFTRDSLRDPAKWEQFHALYTRAVGGPASEAQLNRAAGRMYSPDAGRSAGQYIEAMTLLSRPGADGQSVLQRATPQQISQAATARLVELGRANPGLQAIPPHRAEQIAGALAVPGTEQTLTLGPQGLQQQLRYTTTGTSIDLAQPPAAGPALAEYQRRVRERIDAPTIEEPRPQVPGLMTRPPAPPESARSAFTTEVNKTSTGLAEAERRLSIGTMDTADLLPLAYQAQEHLVGEMRARIEAGQPLTGVMAAAQSLNTEVAKAEHEAEVRRNIRLGTAAVGAIAGIGLMASGPLGWGAVATGGLAVAGGAAAAANIALDAGDFIRQRRAGGLDQAGLVMSNLQRENWGGLVANLGLNTAGALAGIPAVRAAVSAEQAAARLKYAGGLVSAMATEAGPARAAALTRFFDEQGISRSATGGVFDFNALSPERQAAAMRVIERFGPEVDAQALGAMLRFAARDADITAGAGAAAAGNVDHMFAAYTEMNALEAAARGRDLTEQQRIMNAVATIGTDAQGKFGHGTLQIVPTMLADGSVARTPAELLRGVRASAVDAIFDGAPPSVQAWRQRFVEQLVNQPDGGARMKALGEIAADARKPDVPPEVSQWFARRMNQPDLNMRFLPFTEGAYVHNFVDPARVYQMGINAGMSHTDAAESAYRATMHGFGNAFVSSAYPGMPQFRSVMVNGRPLFSEQQLQNLERVGQTSLDYNQRLRPSAAQARAWGISDNPPPAGARQVFTAALRANNGNMPPGLQEWLANEGRAFRAARDRAGIGAGATDSDNLGNYVPDGMRKWAGIFASNPGTPADQVALGDQVARLLMGMNAYSIEEASVGNVARFSANFAGPAERLGMFRPQNSAAFQWIMRKGADGRFVVDGGAPAQAVRSAAAAVPRQGLGLAPGASDAEVLAAFYNQPEANARAALATLAEGDLPPAFNVNAFDWTRPPRGMSTFTQLLLYQQTIGQARRARDSW